MKSKDFPFKIGNKEFEADRTFSGEPAVYKIVSIKSNSGSGFDVPDGYLDLRHINSPEGKVDLRFVIDCFEVGQIIILCREKSS